MGSKQFDGGEVPPAARRPGLHTPRMLAFPSKCPRGARKSCKGIVTVTVSCRVPAIRCVRWCTRVIRTNCADLACAPPRRKLECRELRQRTPANGSLRDISQSGNKQHALESSAMGVTKLIQAWSPGTLASEQQPGSALPVALCLARPEHGRAPSCPPRGERVGPTMSSCSLS